MIALHSVTNLEYCVFFVYFTIFLLFSSVFRNGWFCGFFFFHKVLAGGSVSALMKAIDCGLFFGRFEKYLNNSSTDLRKGFLCVGGIWGSVQGWENTVENLWKVWTNWVFCFDLNCLQLWMFECVVYCWSFFLTIWENHIYITIWILIWLWR